MSRGKLYFTIGLPRSGKTTFCKYHYHGNFVVLSGDDFRHAIHGREYVPEAEGLVFASIDVAARALLRGGYDVIIDETSTTEATILRYLRIDDNAEPIWVSTKAKRCRLRALADNKPYLLGPIERMDAQMKRLKKGFDKKFAKLKAYVQSRRKDDVAV